MVFKTLNNIDTAYRYMRKLSLYSILASSLIVVASVLMALMYAEKQREKIYVLDNGKSLILALSQDAQQNRPAEAREHIRRFHELFFTLSPESSAIEGNMNRAFCMADKSVYDCYQDIAETGYYNRIISANINQIINVDSIKIDFDLYPYAVRTFSTQKIIRETNITSRMLETECRLINTSRTDANPGGFQIENFRIVRNYDISQYKR